MDPPCPGLATDSRKEREWHVSSVPTRKSRPAFLHCLTIAKEQVTYAKLRLGHLPNKRKFKFRGRSRPRLVICIKESTVGPDFLFMEDNERPHSSVEVSDTLQSKNILRIQWSAYSPNLNPVEKAWVALLVDVLHKEPSLLVQCKSSNTP
ncbi:hypothetical protein TNCV_33991 [Trichonephila clavipes]|nr:hypothetical protein TNCV_33991 [Trichonephila clavipes]